MVFVNLNELLLWLGIPLLLLFFFVETFDFFICHLSHDLVNELFLVCFGYFSQLHLPVSLWNLVIRFFTVPLEVKHPTLALLPLFAYIDSPMAIFKTLHCHLVLILSQVLNLGLAPFDTAFAAQHWVSVAGHYEISGRPSHRPLLF